MLTVSPAVSPSVVARILMIQNPRVTAGTFVNVSRSARVTLKLLIVPHFDQLALVPGLLQ